MTIMFALLSYALLGGYIRGALRTLHQNTFLKISISFSHITFKSRVKKNGAKIPVMSNT